MPSDSDDSIHKKPNMNSLTIVAEKKIHSYFKNTDNKVLQRLLELNIYVVGGVIRDILNNKKSICDVDVVSEKPQEVIDAIKKTTPSAVVVLDDQFGVYRIVPHGLNICIDISKLQGQGIKEDLSRRDFTINAIAFCIKGGKADLIDPFSGVRDIHNRTIRIITKRNILDDPLRILRAYRFKAELNYRIDRRTSKVLKELAATLSKPAKERIKNELTKIFSAACSYRTLKQMFNDGALEIIFPAVKSYKNFYAGERHAKDLLGHSFLTLQFMEKFLNNKPPIDYDNTLLFDELEKNVPVCAMTKIASFIHDAGKPQTRILRDGKYVYYNHDRKGAEYAVDLLKGLKYSHASVDFVAKMIRYHMFPFNVIQSMKGKLIVSPKIYMRLKGEFGDYTPLLICLFIADIMATKNDAISDKLIKRAKELYSQYQKYEFRAQAMPVLLNGNDLKELLELSEGPVIGKLLNELKEAELTGKINTKKEAITHIKEYYATIQ